MTIKNTGEMANEIGAMHEKYEALRDALIKLKDIAQNHGLSISIPDLPEYSVEHINDLFSQNEQAAYSLLMAGFHSQWNKHKYTIQKAVNHISLNQGKLSDDEKHQLEIAHGTITDYSNNKIYVHSIKNTPSPIKPSNKAATFASHVFDAEQNRDYPEDTPPIPPIGR